MIVCSVNGRRHDVPPELETWGELLDSLEADRSREGTVVTAVRFRGVDEPSFRRTAARDFALGRVSPVDVEMTPVPALIAAATNAALGGIEALTAAARGTAEAFRAGDLDVANRRLAEFVATFRLLIQLTDAVTRLAASRPGPDLSPAAEADEVLRRLHDGLESLIAHDLKEDWASVADVLDRDISEALPGWAAVLREIGPSPAAARRAS